jgi:hypothetical protein
VCALRVHVVAQGLAVLLQMHGLVCFRWMVPRPEGSLQVFRSRAFGIQQSVQGLA